MTAEWTLPALAVFAFTFVILGLSFGYLMGCGEGYREGFKQGQAVQRRIDAAREGGRQGATERKDKIAAHAATLDQPKETQK